MYILHFILSFNFFPKHISHFNFFNFSFKPPLLYLFKVLEIHRVRQELLRMPKQVDVHRIAMRGSLTLQALGRFDEPLSKKRTVICTLIDHFLFVHHKKAEKTADSVILLEYHTIGFVNTDTGAPLSIREPSADASLIDNDSASSASIDTSTKSNAIAIELRRQNLLYSPNHILAYHLSCMSSIIYCFEWFFFLLNFYSY